MRRGGLRDSGALAAGSAISGLLAYVFFSITTRGLGSAHAAPVSVLWTYWSVGAAVLTFPLQHWIARTAEVDRGEGGLRRARRGVALVVLAAAVVSGGLAWLGRDPLFHRGDAVFPALIAVVTVGSGFVGYVRGVLSARHRFGAVATAMVGENGVRCVLAGALAAVGTGNAAAYAGALIAGQLVGLAWPSVLRLGTGGAAVAAESPLAFLGGVAGGSLIGQVVLTGGPVLLALRGGTAAETTALFATLALFRAPYTLSLGVVAQVTGRQTALVVAGRDDVLRRLRLVLAAGTLALAVAALAVGAALGPALVRLVFGSDVRIAAGPAAVVAVGSVFAVANLLSTLTLIARGRSGAVLRCWLAASAVGAGCLLVAPLSALADTVALFAVAEGAAFGLMLWTEARPPERGRRGGRTVATPGAEVP